MTVADEMAYYASAGIPVARLSVSDARAMFYRGVLDGSIVIGGPGGGGSGNANYTDNNDGTVTLSSSSQPSVVAHTKAGAMLAFVSVVDKDTQLPVVAPAGYRFVGMRASIDMSDFPNVRTWDLYPVFEEIGGA